MKGLADLHVHSRFSDGIHSPTELVRMAEHVGLAGMALTDHDTIDGIDEFLHVDSGIIRVPGIEISSEHEGNEVHILGYFVPLDSDTLKERLNQLNTARTTRFPRMVERMRALGYDIPDEAIHRVLHDVASPGRPHLARVLVDLGIVSSVNEAFERFLAKGASAYVPKEKIQSTDAVHLLASVGAVPVLAHPLLIQGINLHEFIRILVKAGLKGVETTYAYPFYPSREDRSRLQNAIEGLDLIHTGGSDYHGDVNAVAFGEVGVPLSVIDRLREESQ